jgi:hypothetical protein
MGNGKSIAMSKARDPQVAKYPDILKMPDGLTFYADYENKYGEIDAAYSVGSPVATFTNTSGNTPVFTADGISIGTARDDVLKYEIAGNRTAAQETIIIKFKPDSDFANDGVYRILLDSDTKKRRIAKYNNSDKIAFEPNQSDSTLSRANSTTVPAANTSYVVYAIAQHTSPYAVIGVNGTQEHADTDDFTTPGWGEYFYLGSSGTGTLQPNSTIQKIAIFSRALSSTEVAQVSTLMGYD